VITAKTVYTGLYGQNQETWQGPDGMAKYGYSFYGTGGVSRDFAVFMVTFIIE
jgi:hypothetical protein